ncbi:lithocholate 6-beta-hydroxylase-like isoform X2 [Haemaphysalis longicornis]
MDAILDTGCCAWVVLLLTCGFYAFGRWVVRERRKCFATFKDTGIPGPPIQSLIKGNADGFWKPTQIEGLGRWLEEYGDVFGFFLGDAPVVVVKDLDIIQEIFVKDFGNFSSRGSMMHIHDLQPTLAGTLVFSKGQVWREIRNCMSQFFTTAKLKTVLPSLLDAEGQFIKILGDHADRGVEVDIKEHCQRFTFDAIAKAAFGIDTGVQRDPRNPIYQTAIKVLPNMMEGFVYQIGQNLFHWSWLLKVAIKVMNLFTPNPFAEMIRQAKEVIEYRRRNPQVSLPDLAQILLDDALDRRYAEAKAGSRTKSRAPLPAATVQKMATNSTFVFVGGYDPARAVLTYWFYLMGKYPDVQERMRQEALEAFKMEGDHLSVKTLTNLRYANQVISETLRIYPPVITVTTRGAERDRQYGRYIIKKGMTVLAPTYQLHHDPLYWANPETFDPERFSPENKHLVNPIAYQPFGLGPRMCLGQRLALVQLPSAMTQVLRHFRITLGPSQKTPLKLATYAVAAVPRDKVWIQLQRLNSGA